jgi:hypothetical protein
MPLTYLYLPVGTPEMMEFASDWNADQRKKGEIEHPIITNASKGFVKACRRMTGGGMLRMIGNTDTIYVITHGKARGSREIGADRGAVKKGLAWEGGTLKAWTAENFAKHLEKEGLSKDHVDLRMFVCGSGLTPAGSTKPFAQVLYEAMKKNGYSRIVVTGYLGSVRPTSPTSQPSVEYVRTGTLVPAHECCVRFPAA